MAEIEMLLQARPTHFTGSQLAQTIFLEHYHDFLHFLRAHCLLNR